MSLQGKTVLFFAGPLYEDLELWYPKIRLEEEGARTVVAGTGEKTYQGKRGYPLTVDTSVDEIEAADFDGLVIPGGYAPDIMRRSPEAAPAHPGDLPGRQAGRLHLPRRLGADLGRDREGQARHQRRSHQGRPGERGHALGGQPGGGGREPDLVPDAGGSAAVLQGAHRGAGKVASQRVGSRTGEESASDQRRVLRGPKCDLTLRSAQHDRDLARS